MTTTQRPSPRPRFSLRSPLSPSVLRERVNAFTKTSSRVRGMAFDHRIELAIAGVEQHFWSPQVVVTVEPDGEGAVLEARFGPDPYVWALYSLGYGALTILTLFAALFGIAQLMLHQTPSAFIVAPIAGVLAGLAYGASFVGQGLGSDQMYFLRATLTQLAEAEDEAIEASPRA